jgi:hypothetical protein
MHGDEVLGSVGMVVQVMLDLQQKIRLNVQTRNKLLRIRVPSNGILELFSCAMEKMRATIVNLCQTHILQRANSRMFEKSLAWEAS